MCESDERVEAALASVTSPQSGVATINQTPQVESRGVVLRTQGGTITDDPALRPALAKVTEKLDVWEGIGFTSDEHRGW